MGVLIQQDTWPEQDITQDGDVIMELTRVYHVDGLRLSDAPADVLMTPGLPVPSGGTIKYHESPLLNNLAALVFKVRFDGSQQATVFVRYYNTEHAIVRGGGGLEAMETDKDAVGVPLLVDPPTGWPKRALDGQPDVQPAIVTRLFPQAAFSVDIIRPGFSYGGLDPLQLQARWLNKVNASPWPTGNWGGYKKGELLIENIAFDNSEFGNAAIHYVFELRARPTPGVSWDNGGGWNQIATWTNPETGKPGIGTDNKASSRPIVCSEVDDFDELYDVMHWDF